MKQFYYVSHQEPVELCPFFVWFVSGFAVKTAVCETVMCTLLPVFLVHGDINIYAGVSLHRVAACRVYSSPTVEWATDLRLKHPYSSHAGQKTL